MAFMLARQAVIDSIVHAQGSAVRRSYSPEPWPRPIFHLISRL
jgi:hypothetical protein